MAVAGRDEKPPRYALSNYGNNTSFLQGLESSHLKYIGGIAKNRKVIIQKNLNEKEEIRVDKLASSLASEAFTQIQLLLEKPRTVWVARTEIELSKLTGKKVIAIVMNTANNEAFNFSILCLYFYSMAYQNRRIKTQVGK